MRAIGSIALLIAAFLCAGSSLNGQTDRWTILPSGGTGSAITINTSEGQLKRIYGAVNVTRTNIDIGEGASEPGTKLFLRDPLRTLEIRWQERQHLHPRTVTIHGAKSLWKTVHDISLGTTLMQLERLNGGTFELHGFGWDGSGGMTSWKKGLLEKELGEPGVLVWLQLDAHQCDNVDLSLDDPACEQLLGETVFLSAHAGMQKLNPTVVEISWDFPDVKK